MKPSLITIMVISFIFTTLIQGQIPQTMSYQGVLRDDSGNLIADGNYDIEFRLFDAETGGNQLWSESHTTANSNPVNVTDGVFSVILGSSSPLSLDFGQQYWVEVAIGGEALSPRVQLTSSPYSFYAVRSDTASVGAQPFNATYVFAKYVQAINSYSGMRAAEFKTSNTSNANETVGIFQYGTGAALNVRTYGTGYAAEFRQQGSSGDALYARAYGSPGYAGYFEGDVYISGNYGPSDIRWKKNIAPLEGALNMVLALRGVKFEWNRDDYLDKSFREGTQIGLIAQEVEELLPELVKTDKDGYKALDYQKLSAVLVEAIKEQQREIEGLQAAIADLQTRLDVASQE